MLVEGKNIDERVVKDLENIRTALSHVRPEISTEIKHWGTACLEVIYSLDDCITRVVLEVEPRYLKYLGLEIPHWVEKMMNTGHH
jgi:hypothetical protein